MKSTQEKGLITKNVSPCVQKESDQVHAVVFPGRQETALSEQIIDTYPDGVSVQWWII